jgi:hypothetical protein
VRAFGPSHCQASTLLPHAHSLIALLTDSAVVDACADESLRRAALRALAALLRKLGDRGKSALEAAFVWGRVRLR